jgi:putative restriction endonuclease
MSLGRELLTGESPIDQVLSRRYRETSVRARLHQAHFRKNVLAAYATRCAVCELRVRPLLDGAHILPDAHPEGEPVTQNGISMCSLHHRAFDRRILQVTPRYTVAISRKLIPSDDEAARRMILNYEGKPLWLPRDARLRPSLDSLKLRLDQLA